jgi:hypothetical protein
MRWSPPPINRVELVLISAGDKHGQQRDINRATELWSQNRNRILEEIKRDDGNEDEGNSKSVRNFEK